MDPARRAPALRALVVAAAALVSGCTATNPQLTHSAEVTYNPSDGTNVALGPLRVESMMIVSNGGRAPGALVARLVNGTLQPHTIRLAGAGPLTLDQSFAVPPNSTLAVGPDERNAVVLDPVGAQPGQLVHLTVSADSGASRTTVVPVLSGALPEYASLAPTPSPSSTPAPSSPAPAPTGTPTGTGTPRGSATRTTGTPSRPPRVTSTRTASPPGGAPASPLPGQYSPGGSPTG